MLKRRLIPVLFLKNGLIVRSQQFKDFREFGNPINQLERLNSWCVDELIYIDITREGEYCLKRDDLKVQNQKSILDILRSISACCFMPLSFGGRIRTIQQAADFIENGADKIILNTGAFLKPNLVSEIAKRYGSQAVIVGVDYMEDNVVISQGTVDTGVKVLDWVRKLGDLGAGEIFLNSIKRDGMATGYDIEFINSVVSNVKLPVIACGGASSFGDFVELFDKTGVSAAAAGNIFNFTENAYPRAKNKLIQSGCVVRKNREVSHG